MPSTPSFMFPLLFALTLLFSSSMSFSSSFSLLHPSPSPTSPSKSSFPIYTTPPEPYLGLFLNPTTPCPGMQVNLTWLCYYCPPFTVSLTTNQSTLITSAPSNSSLLYTIPSTYTPTSLISFIATPTPSPHTSPPNLTSTLLIPLRPPSPSTFTLTSPPPHSTVYQSTGLTLEWRCSECYGLTLTVTWTGSDGQGGVLIEGIGMEDSGLTVAIPDDWLVEGGEIEVTATVDGHGRLSDTTSVNVEA